MNISDMKGKQPLRNISSDSFSMLAAGEVSQGVGQQDQSPMLLGRKGKVSELLGWLHQKNIQLSTAILNQLELVLEKTAGTWEQKLGTLTVMSDRNIPLSPKHFQAVFQALHGPGLDEILQKLENTQVVLQAPRSLEPKLSSVQQNEWDPDGDLFSLPKEKGRVAGAISGPLQQQVQVNSNPVFPNQIDVEPWKKETGQIPQAQTAEIQEDTQLPQKLFQIEDGNFQAKTFMKVETVVTPQHEKISNDFREIKGQLVKNMGQMIMSLQSEKREASVQAEHLLKSTIDGLNKLINKGEFSLFADMEFEHDILRINGELSQIKDLLQQGKHQEAAKGLQSIQEELKKLHWQPSQEKVQSIFSKAENHILKNPLDSMAKDWTQGTLSARGMQEWVRALGLNHEKEVYQHFLQRDQNSKDLQSDSAQSNLKSLLMQAMDQEMTPRAKQLLENAISHITGLQLLSKQDSVDAYQSLYVQLPLPWKEGTEPVELQIKSRNKGKQLDWENCHIFFYLDTPKYGETGISLQILNMDISLQIQNDHSGVQKAYDPFIPEVKLRLEQMGYHLKKVTFSTEKSKEIVADDKQKTIKSTSSFKRVDVSI